MTLMDKIAVWSLVAAAVAASASVVMLIRNWNAATTKDVKRVEDNTADPKSPPATSIVRAKLEKSYWTFG